MSRFNGTKTEKNLMDAFAGESQARNKYTYFASAAKKEGYEQIAALFIDTANNEMEHAKLWYKLLHDGVGKTVENLKDAAAGEHFEWTEMYANMAKDAREEGFEEVAKMMEGVALVEKRHENRYNALCKNIEDGLVFVRKEEKAWECRNCGHIHFGSGAPDICPICAHPKAYFMIEPSNY